MSGIIRACDIDVSNINFDKIKKRGDGGAKGVRMTYKGSPIVIQISNARVPFGLNCFENEKTSEKKYSLEVSLDDNDAKLGQFKTALEELDEVIISHIEQHSEAWWSRKVSASTIKEAETYKSMVKPDKKGESPPRFRVKLPLYKNKPGFNVYMKGTKEPLEIVSSTGDSPSINWDWAQNGMEVTTLAECEGLWVIGNNVYCTWRAVQVRINRKSNRITEYAFMDDDEDMDDAEEDNSSAKAKTGGDDAASDDVSDDYIEEEEEIQD